MYKIYAQNQLWWYWIELRSKKSVFFCLILSLLCTDLTTPEFSIYVVRGESKMLTKCSPWLVWYTLLDTLNWTTISRNTLIICFLFEKEAQSTFNFTQKMVFQAFSTLSRCFFFTSMSRNTKNKCFSLLYLIGCSL